MDGTMRSQMLIIIWWIDTSKFSKDNLPNFFNTKIHMIFVLGFYPVLDIIHKWFGQLPTKSDVVTLHTASETLSKNTLFATTVMPETYLTPPCTKWAALAPNARLISALDATLDYVPFPAKPASIP